MKKLCHLLILATVLLISCHKKELPETIPAQQSDFYFNGTVSGEQFNLRAGVDNYYMYSSYGQDNNALYSFVADLKPSGCSGCNNSIQILINDFQYTALNADVNIDSSLVNKTYPLLGAAYYAVQFKSLSNQSANGYYWQFGDKSISREANPVHVYSTAGNYSVSLRISSAYGCEQYISNFEKIRYPAANAKISAESISDNTMNFTAQVTGSSGYRYQWNFGDGDTSSSSNPSHSYKIAGTYPVVLRAIDAMEDTVYTRYNVATQTNPMPCLTNYSIESVTRVVNPLPFSNVVVNWTDNKGEVYTSNNFMQPAASNFRILSVEEYDRNERGEKTKKIRVSFSCQVYNGTRIKTIENAEAVLCVAYK